MGTTTVRAGAITFGSIAGGFVRMEVAGLAAAWQAYRTGTLGIGDFRAWLAAREMAARRRSLGAGRSPIYGVAEVGALLGVAERTAAAAVRRLVAIGLLDWSGSAIGFPAPVCSGPPGPQADAIGGGRGMVLVPRRMLRFLARGARPALIATALAALLRCVSRRRSGFGARGRLAASWVAVAFGVDVRRVKQARAELARLGWLAREPGPAWATNRWGAAWVVDLAWPGSRTDCHPVPPTVGAPLPPPCLDPDPLREERNQDPAGRGPAGASHGEGGAVRSRAIPPSAAATPPLPAPDLRAIRVEDLADTGRALELHRQAVGRGRVAAGEAGRVRFVAAVEHARAIGRANPPGLLARIVAEGWWHLATHEDEDRASRRLREHDRAAGAPPGPGPVRRPGVAPGGPMRPPTPLADLLARLAFRPAP